MDKILAKQVKDFYIVNGTGVIKMKINSIDDIIYDYSNMEGYECANPAVTGYIEAHENYIDVKYPLRLEIYCDNLSEEEKKIVTAVLRDSYLYRFNMVEEKMKRSKGGLWFSIIAMVVSYGLFALKAYLPGFLSIVGEIIPIAFSLFATAVITEVFISGPGEKEEYARAKRYLNMDIEYHTND